MQNFRHCTILALVTFGISAQSIFACSCTPDTPTPKEELKDSTEVFVGKVVDVQSSVHYQTFRTPGKNGKVRRIARPDRSGRKVVKFEVEKTWKGVSTRSISISTGSGRGDCGYSFQKGERYLVYANGQSTNICTRTTPMYGAKEDLQALGKGRTIKKK